MPQEDAHSSNNKNMTKITPTKRTRGLGVPIMKTRKIKGQKITEKIGDKLVGFSPSSIRTLITNPFNPNDKMFVSEGQVVNWEKRAKRLANL